jgi:hypothetical protein
MVMLLPPSHPQPFLPPTAAPSGLGRFSPGREGSLIYSLFGQKNLENSALQQLKRMNPFSNSRHWLWGLVR